ncbi:VENN motif pre-toxin domain-containing protein [Pseudomonas citronellolis]|uniref:VENN motif pre-toxin domain-containing protein n=1 Tax=Pseudomonas citronellolis TaxID=53408 RepID=UPI00209E5152|nr:VENN motif pre-toxin domain-containing protein [Pseudomonas citronellolis]MCP1604875.1 hypothetical protein [Pseudomonas citronellolis]MCP1655041.1 hypothetical protein [Pseudomonas citronellolis]MCP1725283.1 hypothetical protein [Pseudomonas citronellolis]
MNESQKQTVSALASLASGMAGGLAGGDLGGAVTGAQGGKNAAENNDMWFPVDPGYGASVTSLGTQMIQAGASPEEITVAMQEKARQEGFEGPDPVKGLLEGWGVVMSAGSFGIGGTAALGAMGTGALIGGGANVSYQLTKDPNQFSYTDATVAALVGAFTQGKSLPMSTVINMGGAYIGSQVKGGNPNSAVVGAVFGAVAGGAAGKTLGIGVASEVSSGVKEQLEGVGGAISSEFVSDQISGIMGKK